MGKQEPAAVQGSDGEQFHFSVYCSFICLWCTYKIFSHFILHLIVEQLTIFNVSMRLNVTFCMCSRLLQFLHPRAVFGFTSSGMINKN